MLRLFIAGFISCTMQIAVHAQVAGTCMSDAQQDRSRCLREAGDDAARQKCLERYFQRMEVCAKAPARR